MSDELVVTPTQEGTAPPAAVVSPTPDQVTSGAAPQAAIATPDSEAQRLKRSQETRERIEELNAGKKAAVEVAEYWRKRFEESQQKPQAAAPVQAEPEPDPDSFDDPKAYTKAYTAWYDKKVEQRVSSATEQARKDAETAADRRAAKAEEERRLKALNDEFGLRQHQFAEKNADYFDVIGNPALTFFNGDFLDALKGSEKGPEIAYQIGTDAKLIARLAGKSVPQRIVELGRIEAELSRPAPPPKVTAAPAPPTPIGGGAGGEVDPSKLSIDDWMHHRTKQILAKRQAR
jgi:hypothetical protein